jgi:hypothetical protein
VGIASHQADRPSRPRQDRPAAEGDAGLTRERPAPGSSERSPADRATSASEPGAAGRGRPARLALPEPCIARTEGMLPSRGRARSRRRGRHSAEECGDRAQRCERGPTQRPLQTMHGLTLPRPWRRVTGTWARAWD